MLIVAFPAHAIARLHPSQLATLAHLIPQPLARWLMARSIPRFLPHTTPTQLFWRRYFQALIQTQPYAVLVHRFHAVLDYHARYRFTATDLSDWPGPLLILEAANETLMASDEMALLRQLYPRAQHVALAGDHLEAIDQPAAQIACLRQFWDQGNRA